jgi:hypothetical protein
MPALPATAPEINSCSAKDVGSIDEVPSTGLVGLIRRDLVECRARDGMISSMIDGAHGRRQLDKCILIGGDRWRAENRDNKFNNSCIVRSPQS